MGASKKPPAQGRRAPAPDAPADDEARTRSPREPGRQPQPARGTPPPPMSDGTPWP